MCEKKREILKPIINACGEKAQMLQTIEECSELIKAICKVIKSDTPENRDNVTEEMADVSLMLNQMMIIFGNEEPVQKVIARKIERTYKRLGIAEK